MEEFTIPASLRQIPHPPQKLYIRGKFPKTKKYLCVVGARRHTSYGLEVCKKLIKEIRNYSVTVVSGLALGIDTVAHLAALENNLPTIAFPGSGLADSAIAPPSHLQVAKKIISSGGCLLSEYEPNYPSANWTFPERNRLMAGIADAVLVIEGKRKSGTMITARMSTDYNKTLMTVPGSIFSLYSEGPNYLIRLGATPVSSGEEIIDALGLAINDKNGKKNYDDLIEKLRETCSDKELLIISKLEEPRSRDQLAKLTNMPVSELNATISLLELKEIIDQKLGLIYLKVF